MSKSSLIFSSLLFLFSKSVVADVSCTGYVEEITRLVDASKISVKLKGTNRFFKVNSSLDFSIALSALTEKLQLTVVWNDSSINSCENGWNDHQLLVGNIAILREHNPPRDNPGTGGGGSGDEDGNQSGLPRSCYEILNSGVSASGSYQIDPDGDENQFAPMSVYCDMQTDGGGWTLVARANQGFSGVWVTRDAINPLTANTADGTTFKFSDQLINKLVSAGYRVSTKDNPSIRRFFKPQCEYNQVEKSNVECTKSYADLSWSDEKRGVNWDVLVGLYDGDLRNLYFVTSDKRSFKWFVGTPSTGYKNDSGNHWPTGGKYPYSASFKIWVK